MNKIFSCLALSLLSIVLFSCSNRNNINEQKKPNIILIMADDMGYECLNSYEKSNYKTPVLDNLASEGMLFSNCISQPLCTPSRVKIMTGKYNYQNYEKFGHLKTGESTFAQLLKKANYSTLIAGKWQLNGLAYKDQIPDWQNSARPHDFGFDEYSLWQLTKGGNEGGRFANPLIEQNGRFLDLNVDDYGPDIFTNYIMDFIERKKDKPFFVYYPMVLVHDPFVPTPDSEDWGNLEKRFKNDTTYFKDMVAYTDKIVGKIVQKLKSLDIAENTVLIFTGDNGTHYSIYTTTENGIIRGGKGNTTDAGTHVPLIVSWPKMMKKGVVVEDLISFNDFYPTLAEVAGIPIETEGLSFYSQLIGEKGDPRESLFVHYDPKWGKRVNQYRNQFVRTIEYKLYPNGDFFNLIDDNLEDSPLDYDDLSTKESEVLAYLQKELKKHPKWNPKSLE